MASDSLEPHVLVRLLGRPAGAFTAGDLERAVDELGLRQVNLRYVGGDGRLKTVAFPINSRAHLREPLPHAREQIVRRAAEVLHAETGLAMEAFGEVEYYLAQDLDDRFPVEEERGYQESAPFSKGQRLREEVLGHLAAMGIATKYAHGEVGNVREDDRQLVQHEIELSPVPLDRAADALVLTKWVVREVADRHGVEVTFAPTVSTGGAGNGLHVHTRLVRDGANALVDDDGALTDTARRLIAGLLAASPALTAFGNTVPTSYLRFAEGSESPEAICWAETDRTGLVRVPLAWGGGVLPRMVAHANPDHAEPVPAPDIAPQTVELRLADGSADVHLLLAGMAVAARHGLRDPGSLERAERWNADGRDADAGDFGRLPSSSAESADALEEARGMFEADGVFPSALIDAVLADLRDNADGALTKKAAKSDSARAELIAKYWHVG